MQDDKLESHSKKDKEDLKQTEAGTTESTRTSNSKGVKRRRTKLQIDQQLPAKVSKLDESQEALLTLSTDIDCGKSTETEKQVDTDKHETDSDVRDAQLPLHSGEGLEQEKQQDKTALPKAEVNSQPEPEAIPSDSLKESDLPNPTQTDNLKVNQSLDINGSEESPSETPDFSESPADAELPKPSSTDTLTPPEQTRTSIGAPFAVKAENLELEHLKPAPRSNSPNSSQHSTTPLVKSEVPNVVFRRKRGAGSDTQPKTNCSDEEKEANASVGENVIYTKKGGKTLLKCGYCGRSFKFLSQFVIHQRIHTGERPNIYQKCPYCKIKFSSEESKKKVCQYCGKSFPFQSALIRHVRVHTGEKPYKCDICGKAFGQAYFLRVHELTHWSVKRYNCTHCEKSFTHYSNAKNHSCRPLGSDDNAQEHRRPKPSLTYTCHICKNVFDHLQEFNTHMREHTGAKLYRCLYCDKLFGVLSEFNDPKALYTTFSHPPIHTHIYTLAIASYILATAGALTEARLPDTGATGPSDHQANMGLVSCPRIFGMQPGGSLGSNHRPSD
uniref:C2H2-type domain-containing protein n=1 Tax=Pundamilia nyererei TaxID=303518 RepID=A0A3B4FEV8_9CICH